MGSAPHSNVKRKKNEISFKCTYEITNYNETQILNYKDSNEINEEILSKIKILNGNKKEDLIFLKKFKKIGLNTVCFIIEEKLTNMSFLFNKCSSLKQVEFISFDTSQVTEMVAMFQKCEALEYLDLSKFDTANVTNMECMFNKCNKLKEIKGIENFDTNNVINMRAMFQKCSELEYLNLSNFNATNVTNMQCMFNKCNKLKEIQGIENFKTNNVKNMRAMFQECYRLEYLNLSNK